MPTISNRIKTIISITSILIMLTSLTACSNANALTLGSGSENDSYVVNDDDKLLDSTTHKIISALNTQNQSESLASISVIVSKTTPADVNANNQKLSSQYHDSYAIMLIHYADTGNDYILMNDARVPEYMQSAFKNNHDMLMKPSYDNGINNANNTDETNDDVQFFMVASQSIMRTAHNAYMSNANKHDTVIQID